MVLVVLLLVVLTENWLNKKEDAVLSGVLTKMSTFQPTQQEIENKLDAETQSVIIVDPSDQNNKVSLSDVFGTYALNVKVLSQPTTSEIEEKTFVVFAKDISIGNNKSMLSLYNSAGSDVVVKIKQIAIRNVRVSSITGVVADFQLKRITNHSGGILLTPEKRDTQDVLSSFITARTGATINGLLDRWVWSSDDWGPGTLDQEGLEHSFQNSFPASSIFDPSEKRITLREAEGITLQQTTNSSNGVFDVMFVFTQID